MTIVLTGGLNVNEKNESVTLVIGINPIILPSLLGIGDHCLNLLNY